MANVASVSGGLDVPTLVSQLMTLERRPIDELNAKVTSYQTKISSFGTLSSLVSSLQAAVQGFSNNLQAYSATPSDTSILSASATSSAVAGTYTLNVTSLAQSQNLVAAGQASSNTAISDGVATTVTFDFGTIVGGTLTAGKYTGATFTSNGTGTKSVTIDGSNNTLQGIRDAINAANMGVTATIINDGSATPNRLTLTSNVTGISSSVKITTAGGDGSINTLLGYDPAATQNLTQTLAAQNANFTANGIAITSTSNTVSSAIQGVNLTLNKVTTSPTTLTVARDNSAIRTAASGFVDAYNALYSQLKSRSAYGTGSAAAPALAGDGTVRLMLDQLRDIITSPATPAAGGSLSRLAQVGINLQTDGSLKLDSVALTSAMANNFSDVSNLFSSATGFATRLDSWATSAISANGIIATRTANLNSSIQRYNSDINTWEARMTVLQKQYTTTYSNLNMVLSSMNSTSNYLTQQLGKL